MNPTRRAAIRLLATSTALVSIPALAATMSPQAPEPDTDLVALYAEWQRLDEAYLAEVEAKEPAEEEYERLEPPRPAALKVKPFDAFEIEHGIEDLPNGKRVAFYYPGCVEQLRALPAPTRAVSASPDHDWVWIPDARRIARKAEIIAAHDAWTAEKKALADRLGITVGRARTQALCDAQLAIEDQIRETPPVGLPGLIIKAEIAEKTGCSRMWDQVVIDVLALRSGVA